MFCQIRDEIGLQLHGSPYSIIADETTDCSTTEQLCIAVRYLQTTSNNEYEITERFLRFKRMSGVTGM